MLADLLWALPEADARRNPRQELYSLQRSPLGGWPEVGLTGRLGVQDVEATARRMAGLRVLGVSVAINAFGAGHSALVSPPR